MSSGPDRDRILRILLDRHGVTFAKEAGIPLGRGTPAPLFQLLCLSLLLSARIRAEAATTAARALFDAGLTTAEKTADAGWDRRRLILNRSGYVRYDESTSRMLGDTSNLILDEYHGDLRNLRVRAERDIGRERALLRECKGIGEVGVNIFFREVQGLWDELYPFADEVALDAAGDVGLPTDADSLAKLVPRSDFSVLAAALIRSRLARDGDEILAEATS